ncbi:MAG: hypothetical protein LBI92_01535 [Azoarcus sp.]|nr:hypothetical protein [Azoarcus sp.]
MLTFAASELAVASKAAGRARINMMRLESIDSNDGVLFSHGSNTHQTQYARLMRRTA